MEDRGPGLEAPRAYGHRPREQDPALFVRDLRAYTKRTWVTPTLIAINFALFAMQIGTGVDFMSPSIEDLMKWGANFGPLTMHGEWWRLFTACFLHIGIMHIGFNMFAMWRSGVFVEQLFGNLPFLVLYLVAGLGGSVVSIVVHSNTVSAGASGAIFGIFGGLAGYLARNRNSMPKSVLRGLGSNVVQIIILNVIIGVAVPGIDMAAHGGGLVVGAIVGFALAQPLTPAGVKRRLPVAAAVLVASLALLFAGTRLVPEHGDLVSAVTDATRMDNAARELLEPAATSFENGELPADRFIPQANAAKAKLAEAIARLDAVTNLSDEERGMREKYRQYFQLRVQRASAMIEYAQTQNEDALTRAQDLARRIDAQVRAISEANQTP